MVDSVRTERNAALLQLPHLRPGQARTAFEVQSLVGDEGSWQVDSCGKAVALKDRLCVFEKILVTVIEGD